MNKILNRQTMWTAVIAVGSVALMTRTQAGAQFLGVQQRSNGWFS